jgi:hypothetical protein
VFSGDPGSMTRLPSTRVEVVNADGSGRRVVTGQKDRFFSEPAWSQPRPGVVAGRKQHRLLPVLTWSG